ncbi:uncharacterized protein MELLADRAFT_60377 [Melampsora larici-populina 98AG31]|uniref:Uncharacterized protein n=1 Tax=Melampsora larici-populina (strain 98AG31 / pathotype 3-4-7) TaxID=747676 RepID=F4R9W2_MELLP|nr:uncharacterized protein MELLADRAFT_60377 [Melampsora larici-populina 98AG31]EGG10669.1 hypothetical protein MELLADRAFT_60377 [Melampsora larici-populina 98AG31]
MQAALDRAAEAAEALRVTRSHSVATGQAPGPPLATPRRNSNKQPTLPPQQPPPPPPHPQPPAIEIPDDVDDLDGDEITEGDGIGEVDGDLHRLDDGPLLESDEEDDSYAPPRDKGKGRRDDTSPTPSNSGSGSASSQRLHSGEGKYISPSYSLPYPFTTALLPSLSIFHLHLPSSPNRPTSHSHCVTTKTRRKAQEAEHIYSHVGGLHQTRSMSMMPVAVGRPGHP